MATIRIQNLRLKAVIGVNAWERKIKQDVVINITFEYNSTAAVSSDGISHAYDYKRLTKQIIERVERSNVHLLEKLADVILEVVNDSGPAEVITVRIDKPGALRHADSVSVELHHDSRE